MRNNFILLFIIGLRSRDTEIETESDRTRAATRHFCPQVSVTAEAGQGQSGPKESRPGLPWEWQEPRKSGLTCCLPGICQQELGAGWRLHPSTQIQDTGAPLVPLHPRQSSHAPAQSRFCSFPLLHPPCAHSVHTPSLLNAAPLEFPLVLLF